MNETFDKLRLRFSKTGRAIYISHLDLMRTMQRAFLRSGIKLKNSEGFNPHPLISLALPLSVGTASLCEIMDFRLSEYMELSEIPFRLNKSLPEGIEVTEVYKAVRKPKEIKWLDVDGVFEYDTRQPDEMLEGLIDFFQRESIVIEKKTKSGVSDFDLAPNIRSLSFDVDGGRLMLKALVSAQEPTLNPELLLVALHSLAPELAPDFAAFTRTQLYDHDMEVFR
ncbi:MAG: DUF2344 domain-containing protein [Clostridiales bacterium]|nr:DUF2344 domain-containing protein [Clostridiales bacterium]